MTFQDHFSGVAGAYARSRPTYPAELFDWLAAQSPACAVAWDCATGNGQAARALASHFACVLATDGSIAQLQAADRTAGGIRYAAGLAEAAPIASGSVDCVVVAQAAHWFDLPRFFGEVRRIARPGALVALWCYVLMSVDDAVDAVIDRLYRDVLASHWPPRRHHVETEYRELEVPFPAVAAPEFHIAAEAATKGCSVVATRRPGRPRPLYCWGPSGQKIVACRDDSPAYGHMEVDWDLAALRAYLATWSASQRYRAALGCDPLEEVDRDLRAAWGAPESRRRVVWPLHLRAARAP